MCKDRSEDLYLNGKQRPGKDKNINLTYANSTYTNPFLLVSFSLLFSTCWRKHVERMAADWADAALHRAEEGPGSLPGAGGASPSVTRVGVSSAPGPGPCLEKAHRSSLSPASQNDWKQHLPEWEGIQKTYSAEKYLELDIIFLNLHCGFTIK